MSTLPNCKHNGSLLVEYTGKRVYRRLPNEARRDERGSTTITVTCRLCNVSYRAIVGEYMPEPEATAHCVSTFFHIHGGGTQ